MKWLDGSMYMTLSKLWETVNYREAWKYREVHGNPWGHRKSDWTE